MWSSCLHQGTDLGHSEEGAYEHQVADSSHTIGKKIKEMHIVLYAERNYSAFQEILKTIPNPQDDQSVHTEDFSVIIALREI